MSNYVQSTNFATKDALSSGDPLKIVRGTEINTEFNNIATAVATKADLNSPTLVTPALGTPVSGNLANCTFPTLNQSTSGNAATATALQTARTIGGVSFNGTANINLPGVNTAGNQNTSGNAATATLATNATNAATANSITANALAQVYPVGSILINTSGTNPNSSFGFGTWVQFAAGRVLMGVGGAFGPGTTGGSNDATLPTHTHTATSTVSDPGHAHGINNGPGGSGQAYTTFAGAFDTSFINTDTASTGITVSTTNSTAGSSATNANLQPYIVVYMWNRTA